MEIVDSTLTINNHQVNYSEAGSHSSIAVIFIHGFPFSKEMWRNQMEALEHDFRVIAYDVRGHGRSSSGDDTFSLELFATDLVGLMNALGIEKAILSGLSMGGYIALRTIELHASRFIGLVLCDTQCVADSPESREKRIKAIASIKANGVALYAKASITNLFTEESFRNKDEIITKILNTIEQTSSETLCRTLLALSNRKETCTELHAINIPTLVIVGREDKITPITVAQQLHERIKNSTFVIIDQAGHLSNLENPVQFNSNLKLFLSQFLPDIA